MYNELTNQPSFTWNNDFLHIRNMVASLYNSNWDIFVLRKAEVLSHEPDYTNWDLEPSYRAARVRPAKPPPTIRKSKTELEKSEASTMGMVMRALRVDVW